MQDIDHSRYVLTEEATSYLAAGSPEAQVFNVVPEEGLPLPQLKVQYDLPVQWCMHEQLSLASKLDEVCLQLILHGLVVRLAWLKLYTFRI